ncbi:hypothetical protein FA10DRAFT_277906 [Acaromyces ingoldii]|uniref:RING-type domain-containing protein n=1 Tax=Acaromyces ingoldii TaxID=215250 RepID=A0A316YZY2_9BASI|nr:hypothetical protein FA10DRAFT_277906 [Acaromyces ingoldii]PWN94344.1 hypothetical protein FA10DRAFT_277906 [Acaromyces ingoldii]
MSVDESLRCNFLSCRKSLNLDDIFCFDCANQLFSGTKTCPACETYLGGNDELALTELCYSADRKTVIQMTLLYFSARTHREWLISADPLGRSHTSRRYVRMEICSRAISFYQYQSMQEAAFQRMILKNAQERAAVLETRIENIVAEANNEVKNLQNTILSFKTDLEVEKEKNHNLSSALRTSKADYDRLKAQWDSNLRKSLNPGTSQGAKLYDAAAAASFSGQSRPFVHNGMGNGSIHSSATFSSKSKHMGDSRPIWQAQLNDAAGGVAAAMATPSHHSRASPRVKPSFGKTHVQTKSGGSQPFVAGRTTGSPSPRSQHSFLPSHVSNDTPSIAQHNEYSATGTWKARSPPSLSRRMTHETHETDSHGRANVDGLLTPRQHRASAGLSRSVGRDAEQLASTPRPAISAMPLPTPRKNATPDVAVAGLSARDHNSHGRVLTSGREDHEIAEARRAGTPAHNSFRFAPAS